MSEEISAPAPVQETQEDVVQDATEENTVETPAEAVQEEPKSEQVVVYKCQQCRVPLFTSRSILPHQATQARKFANKRRDYGENECTSFFIEKPPWLDATGRKADTIKCPKCGYKIGHFNWIGSQCSCGEWIKPSFQVPKSRVDSM